MITSNTATPLNSSVPLSRDVGVIGLVGLAHMVSHFSQLLLPSLFPWLKDEFNVSYAQLGFLMTIFFVVSCAVQTLSGFVVDRLGPRPILFAGLSLLGLAAFGYAISTSYWMLAGFAVVAGIGNGVFHPVDYTLINRKVSAARLGHAYSVHGITGSLGWALAPALVVSLTLAYSWRLALVAASLVAFAVLAVLVLNRRQLTLPPALPVKLSPATATGTEGSLDFLKIPAVWMCFGFFFVYAIGLSVVQAFAPEAARRLHEVPLSLVALCLTVYMVGSACGMVSGGFLAVNPARCERIVGIGFGFAAVMSVTLAFGSFSSPSMVPVLFALMGFSSGLAAPSRDLLVKRSTPDNATGRVYGVVYSGLDVGQALSPLIFGLMMDQGHFRGVLLGLALVQGVLIVSAFNVQRVRRTALVTA
jgi:FSR family fosmidomycin resistance protein-like MFS transporter